MKLLLSQRWIQMLQSQLIQCLLEKFSRGYYLMRTDCVMLFIGTEHLCGFRALSYKIKLVAIFNKCRKKCFCECTWWDTFWGLPDLSCDIHSWELASRKMYRPIGTRLLLASNFRLHAFTNCTISSMSISSEHFSSCIFQRKKGLCPLMWGMNVMSHGTMLAFEVTE